MSYYPYSGVVLWRRPVRPSAAERNRPAAGWLTWIAATADVTARGWPRAVPTCCPCARIDPMVGPQNAGRVEYLAFPDPAVYVAVGAIVDALRDGTGTAARENAGPSGPARRATRRTGLDVAVIHEVVAALAFDAVRRLAGLAGRGWPPAAVGQLDGSALRALLAAIPDGRAGA